MKTTATITIDSEVKEQFQKAIEMGKLKHDSFSSFCENEARKELKKIGVELE